MAEYLLTYQGESVFTALVDLKPGITSCDATNHPWNGIQKELDAQLPGVAVAPVFYSHSHGVASHYVEYALPSTVTFSQAMAIVRTLTTNQKKHYEAKLKKQADHIAHQDREIARLKAHIARNGL